VARGNPVWRLTTHPEAQSILWDAAAGRSLHSPARQAHCQLTATAIGAA